MAGPLPSSRWHQDSYADAVRHALITDCSTDRRAALALHRGGPIVGTVTTHRITETTGGLMISKRTAGNRLPVELQVTTGVLGGGGWQPYNSSWAGICDRYGEPQENGGHPLHQRPLHATVSCEWKRQDC